MPHPFFSRVQAAEQQQQQQPPAAATAATDGSAAGPVQALTDAVPVAPSADAAAAAKADHEHSTAASDSDDMGSESEEEHTDRGWGTYAPIAAAIEAGRKVEPTSCARACRRALADPGIPALCGGDMRAV